MNKVWVNGLLCAAVSGGFSATAFATTEITWWHAMGGQLGETVNHLATEFNASQDEYKLTPVYKGSYTETLTAGIAAFRAGQAPNILQVFDAGAATIINRSQATHSAHKITLLAYVTFMRIAKAK